MVGFTPRLQVDGDRARGEGMWLAVERDAGVQPTVSAVGHYADELVREDGSWVFAARRAYLDIPPARAPVAAQVTQPVDAHQDAGRQPCDGGSAAVTVPSGCGRSDPIRTGRRRSPRRWP